MPWPLQERFASRLAEIPPEGQKAIDQALIHVVDMMKANDIDAWPVIGSGNWTDQAEQIET
jgi:hypothetical protein